MPNPHHQTARCCAVRSPIQTLTILLTAGGLFTACPSETLNTVPDLAVPEDTGPIADAGQDLGPTADLGTPTEDLGPLPKDMGTPQDAGEPDQGPFDAGEAPDLGSPDMGMPLTIPPPAPVYSQGACPTLNFGPDAQSALNVGFPSGGEQRQFRVLVPSRYDGSTAWPVVFAWHWLNASSNSFIRDGELESAVDEMGFIAVLPDRVEDASGDKVYLFDWPFVEANPPTGADRELQFFDDMFSCVNEQFNVDLQRVYGIGVSAGGLWLSYFASTSRVNHMAAIVSLSGGLGEVANVWRLDYTPMQNKFPALVLWGGSSDWLGVNFDTASQRLRDELINDNHFVMTCVHDSGHQMPPIEAPMGSGTRFWSLWTFMLDHPYGLGAGASPYLNSGIPAGFPPWCQIP